VGIKSGGGQGMIGVVVGDEGTDFGDDVPLEGRDRLYFISENCDKTIKDKVAGPFSW
jgi:hypothetical protein